MNPEIKQAIEEYLRGLLGVLKETAEFQYRRETDQEIHLNLQGTHIFDGVDFKALKALGYLTEIAIRRRLGRSVKVHLDINDQQGRRIRELQQRARQLAEEALRQKKRIELEPMEKSERKAIHEALSTFSGVRTYSQGHGSERRVVIEPVI